MRYRPEIDGLRALAVMPVILLHAGFGLFGGGNAAVFERGVKRTLDYFARQGKTIVLVAPVPEYGFAVPSRAFKAWLNKADTASLNLPLSAYRRRNEEVMRTFGQFKTFPNLTIVPPQNFFCGVSTAGRWTAEALFVRMVTTFPTPAANLSAQPFPRRFRARQTARRPSHRTTQ